MCLTLAISACTQRSQTLVPPTPATSQMAPTLGFSQTNKEPLKLREVRVIELPDSAVSSSDFPAPGESHLFFRCEKRPALVIDVHGGLSHPRSIAYNRGS